MAKEKEKDLNIYRKTFMYRAYPNAGTTKRLIRNMKNGATPVWNDCVAEREAARNEYRDKLNEALCDYVQEAKRDITEQEEKKIRQKVAKTVHWPTAYDQYKHVKKSSHPEYANYNAKMLECVVAKVDSSEKSYLALWIKGDRNARPPRQTYLHDCLTYRGNGWKPEKPENGRVKISMIGDLKFKQHRPIEGTVKTVSITRNNGKWYIGFSCEITKIQGVCRPVPASNTCSEQDLRQEYYPSGGEDPNLGCTDNLKVNWSFAWIGGEDPNLGCTDNLRRRCVVKRNGGEDPNLGCTDNDNQRRRFLRVGGEDPKKVKGSIEIAFGLRGNIFIVDSNGYLIEHPEYYTSDLERLEKLNQKLARRTKWECLDCKSIEGKYKTVGRKKVCLKCGGENIKKYCSKNWYKARHTLRKWHEHIAAKRQYFLWNLVKFYTDTYKEIIVQKWPMKKEIQYASDNKTARKLCDGAYSNFVQMLKHKCNEKGIMFTERKDSQWQNQIEILTEQAKMEGLTKILWQARKAVKRKSPALFRYLETACERLTMLRI